MKEPTPLSQTKRDFGKEGFHFSCFLSRYFFYTWTWLWQDEKKKKKMRLEVLNISINLIWCRVTLCRVPLMRVKESSAKRQGGQRGSSFHLKRNQRVSKQVRPLIRLVLKPAHQIYFLRRWELADSSQDCVWTFPACIVELFSRISFHPLKENFLKAAAQSCACGDQDGGM